MSCQHQANGGLCRFGPSPDLGQILPKAEVLLGIFSHPRKIRKLKAFRAHPILGTGAYRLVEISLLLICRLITRTSLSVTQALVRVDQTGESSGSSSCFSQVQVFCSSESFRTITIKMDKLSYLAIPSEGGGGGNSIVFSVQKGKCYPSRFQTTGNKNRLERVTCEANFVAVKIYLTICLGFTL